MNSFKWYPVKHRFPTPRPWTATCPWPVGNLAAQHEVRAGASLTVWAPPSLISGAALECHRSMNPAVNCVCQGSRYGAPYENLMPDNLRQNSFIPKSFPFTPPTMEKLSSTELVPGGRKLEDHCYKSFPNFWISFEVHNI